MNIEKILSELSQIRPVFHSEADFQHALAWQIQKTLPSARVRLEYPYAAEKRIFIDIWMSDDQVSTAIELKYKTRKLEAVIKDEPFFLRDHAATDLARYDFWKDVQRLEQVASKSKAEAFAIIITNDSALWGTSKRQDTFDAEFKINDGRHLSSEVMHWHEETSVGTRKGREPNIVLRGDYNLRWQQYSLLKDVRNGDFRVLILKIN